MKLDESQIFIYLHSLVITEQKLNKAEESFERDKNLFIKQINHCVN
jgi:hypothetical protein